MTFFLIAALAFTVAFRTGQASPRDAPETTPRLEAWWTDGLTQVLTDAMPPDGISPEGRIHAARGEWEAIQLALRASEAMTVCLEARPFAENLPVRIRRVGRVPITRGTHYTPVEERVAPPPADLPDPLFPETVMELAPARAESFWLDVFVPRDAAPGTFRTAAKIRLDGAPGEDLFLPLVLEIHAATVPFETSLPVTNWFTVRPKEMGFGDAPVGSDAWWACADALFDSMWAHRQNMFWTPLRSPWIRPHVDDAGHLAFDFTFFDRWVETFSRPRGGERATYIEGQPISHREGGYNGIVKATFCTVERKKVIRAVVDADDPEAQEGYGAFLTALRDHLKEKGWLDRFRLHLCDEPHGEQLAPYAALAGYVREFAPEIRIMEALDVKDDYAFFERNCDVWVPQLGRFEKSLPGLLERIARGKEVWVYTCLWPNGRYPNRFVDYPLVKTRVLPWICFKWGFSGFLHWGFNHWRGGDPFTVLEPHHGGETYLPAGDAWIVYPGKKGVIDSIRHEAFRDGLEDHELLRLLAARDPARALAIAHRIVPGFQEYARDPAVYIEMRRRLLEALDAHR